MEQVKTFFAGKKTYLLSAVGVVWAVEGWGLGQLDEQSAMGDDWGALTEAALRAGVAKR